MLRKLMCGALFAATFTLPASAQSGKPLTEKECSDVISIAAGVVERYKGKISKDLVESFVRFGKSRCNFETKFVRVDGTSDDDAFGEFRVLMTVYRRPK